MRVALDASRMTLGRGSDADIVVPDAEVARLQAVIEWDGKSHRITDLSGRSLPVGGQRVESTVLEDGADLVLGQFRAAYTLGLGEPDAGESRARVRTESGEPESGDLPRELVVSASRPDGKAPFSRALSHSMEVGSGTQAAFRLDHPTVSSRHCKVHRHGGRLLLTDLGSTNGTWLNGLRIYEVELPVGGRFRVGPFEVTVGQSRGGSAAPSGGSEFEGIVSVDPAMRALFAQIDKVAGSSAPVAIFGETGSGKELVARAVHRRSSRAAKAWVPLNCSAIARELMESELFGHEKGAFTGATGARSGALNEADGGTLFLDEIGELPIELQAKLLRAVDLGEVKRVGAARPTTVDVRFVCATHRLLTEEVRKGRFREDLYYRIAVATLFVPPLRQRKADIPLLWEHFINRLAPPGARLELSEEAQRVLAGHGWPGNVRELRNVVQRALLASSGSRIEASDIQFDDRSSGAQAGKDEVIDPRGLTLEQIERGAIEIVMRQVKGNRRAASRQLDIAKSTLLKKLTDYQLEAVGAEEDDEE